MKKRFAFLEKKGEAIELDAPAPDAAEPVPDATPSPRNAAPPSPAPADPPPVVALPPKSRARPKSTDAPKQRGRPSGKRSDGEHVQVTAYIQRKTHRAVKLALLKDEGGPDFSELVEELLAKWLRSRT